ncbi:MAG: hypothetical protein AAGE99_06205, partial [Chlamydiota bacterium]
MAKRDNLPMFDLLYELELCKTLEERNLLLMKGVFPYDFCDSVQKMKNTQHLPDREAFYNTLTMSAVSDEDYEHAQRVFTTFNCRHMEDYLKLYNRLDTALLCIAFQSYREHIFSDFGLDPAHYISTPMLAMDCFLKSSQVSIALIHEANVALLAMNNIRGGLSQVNTRHVAVDGKNEHLFYIDANNLYGFSMCHKLPIQEYVMLSSQEAEAIDWLSLTPEDEYGYIVEADMEYPEHLHQEHRDLPLIFNNAGIDYGMLSPYSRRCLREQEINTYDRTKLCSDFLPKTKIAMHYLNLRFYLQEGLIIKKLYCAVRFEQRAFIKPHINIIAEKRKNASTDFAKRNLKLCANS